MTPDWEASADLVVAGSGAAGLTAALTAHEAGLRVVVVTKSALIDGNTRWAQGGIAVVLPGEHRHVDSPERHTADTIAAGAGLCDEGAVALILAGGAAAVARLRQRGAVFDREPGGEALARGREGGHSAFRVLHAGGDATGAEVERALAGAARRARIPVLERHLAAEVLLTDDGAAAGLLVLGAGGDGAAGRTGLVLAPAVLLATGGLGQLYQVTSNPDVATADGLALALRAGAAVADAEFVQFHPTVLYTGAGGRGTAPLVTEALRGEGAVLVDATGARVMTGVHPLADLAPRDVVAAAITRRMAQAPGGVDDHVFLDATGLGAAELRQRFPSVRAACLAAGVDPARQPIPVAPAAHYHCGGVVTDLRGQTGVPGLYAAGEAARTGLHGANRLASNSLLEGLVMGERAAAAIAARLAERRPGSGRPPQPRPLPDRPVPDQTVLDQTVLDQTVLDQIGPAADPATLRQLMSRHAAIGRDGAGLAAAQAGLAESVRHQALASSSAGPAPAGRGSGPVRAGDVGPAPAGHGGGPAPAGRGGEPVLAGGGGQHAGGSRDRYEAAALTLAARAVLAAAAERTESRGCHVRTDHPARDDAGWRRTLVIRLAGSGEPEVTGTLEPGAPGDAGAQPCWPGGLAGSLPVRAVR
jgi:L-aspartate oxidase